MKQVFLLLGAGALVFTSCVSNPEGKKAETVDSVAVFTEATGAELPVNTSASEVQWLGRKTSGQHNGDVELKSGSLFVDAGRVTGGNFVIDLTTINTTDLDGEYKEKLDGHLKADDFFHVAEYPEASFVITEVKEGDSEGEILVTGNLTIRGVTKGITFDATVVEVTDTDATVTADFNIAREDWGISYAGQADDLISKEINFKIKLVAGV